MAYQVILIGNPPDSSWATVLQAALDLAGGPTFVSEAGITQTGLQSGFDLAIIDAVTVVQPERLVDLLHRAHPTLPIVVVSASPTWRRARVNFLAGATDYLYKTLDPTELRPALQRAISHLRPPVDQLGE